MSKSAKRKQSASPKRSAKSTKGAALKTRPTIEKRAKTIRKPKKPREMVWAVIPPRYDNQPDLAVLPRESFEHWILRAPVFLCSTWGELRKKLAPEVYAEVCDLCGYGSFEAFTQHLSITGAVMLPGVFDVAAKAYDPDAIPPVDSAQFDPHDDIGACADGDWPPAVQYLMNSRLPAEILDTYAEFTETTLNGTFVNISSSHKDEVLRDLAALGFRVVEEPRLADLVFCRDWRPSDSTSSTDSA